MATVVSSVSHSNSEHIAAAVRDEQRAYTFKIAVSMALYACLFFVLGFCGPYVLPAITLFSDAPLTDRHIAASQLLLLSDTVWVAIPVFFLGAILFSLLVTRRIGDAIERLGQSARAWASGLGLTAQSANRMMPFSPKSGFLVIIRKNDDTVLIPLAGPTV